MHALELIEKSYKFKRQLVLTDFRKELERKPGECTWCGKQTGGKRVRWCSQACRDEGYIRAGFHKEHVRNRDKGVCQICKLDTKELQNRIAHMLRKADGRHGQRNYPFSWTRIRRYCKATGLSAYGTCYEIDHITPVIEGGGCCGLDNLRTVCLRCHKIETKNLAARRAAERRDKQRALLHPQ